MRRGHWLWWVVAAVCVVGLIVWLWPSPAPPVRRDEATGTVAAPPPAAPPPSSEHGRPAGTDSIGNRAPTEPDSALTPGDTLAVSVAEICTPGYTQSVRNVPAAEKRAVYRRYGIFTHRVGEYEVDHLISLELGGSNSERNLWPESYWTAPWNAHIKDVLENTLHRDVCEGTISLHEAQREIAADWVSAYQTYVEPGNHRRRRAGMTSRAPSHAHDTGSGSPSD